MAVARRMSPTPPTVSPESDCLSALSIMRESGLTVLPVVDDEEFVGIIDEKEIFQRLPWTADGTHEGGPNLELLSVVRVAGVMSYGPATIDDTTPLPEALRLMAHSGASALPVLHLGRLVGVFTVSNALRAALEMLRVPPERDEEKSE